MRELKQIHASAITHGLARFAYIASKILAFCAKSEHKDLRYAESLFNHMLTPNVFDYNSMIMGFSRNSEFDKVHTQIVKLGNFSDVFVVSSALNMYSKHGAIQVARNLFDESSHKNVVCWTSLISGYCDNGLVNEARNLFDAIPQRNDVSYSAMISGYVKNGFFNEGIELFHEMKSSGNLKPNKSLLVSVLTACATLGAFEDGKWVHSYIVENGFTYELEIGTALIDFYAKCGFVQEADHIFTNLSEKEKDVTTWSVMILGLGINGRNKPALDLFAQMEKIGPKPNAVTFVGVLNACNHKFLLDEAWRLFGRMYKVYGILPSIEHYGCMVDTLARAGRTKEAEVLIKSMPIKPDGAIWGSILNGCLLNGDTELGLRIGKLLIKLEPLHSGRYVLLANMYASMGKWECVSEMRKMMKDRGDMYSVLSLLGKELEDFAVAEDASFI
ncbi:hypothetical protein K1719_032894 [Acacia pycnantha]|nr:hypothetical protein K1719_032894 [Acacia pycnantha]